MDAPLGGLLFAYEQCYLSRVIQSLSPVSK